MRILLSHVAILLVAGTNLGTREAGAQQKESHLHIDHVMTSWNETPDQRGLLPTAEAEAATALEQINLMLENSDDLEAMKKCMTRALHALAPSRRSRGPGLGYGVRRAARGVVQHIGLAASADDASDNVELHALHVSTSAGNVVAWVEEVVRMSRQVTGTIPAYRSAAIIAAQQIHDLVVHMIEGYDANADGTIGWQEGEGGLAQARQHMGFMAQGEGMI